MRANGFRSLSLALGALLALGAAPPPKKAPPGSKQGAPQPTLPKVVLEELVENRVSGTWGFGPATSSIRVSMKLEGEGASSYPAGRVLVKEARDDGGRSLIDPESENPEFRDLRFGSLQLNLAAPPRSSRSIGVSGTVELFAPEKDPAAIVKVPNALRKLDTPLDSPGLAAAKLQITPLSKARYTEEVKKQHGEEAKARFRAEMKKDGMPEEQIEKMLRLREELGKAFDSDEAAYSVYLLAKPEDYRRVQAVTFLGADGQEIHTPTSTGGSDGITMTQAYSFAENPGPNVTIVFTLLTDRAKLSIPFALKNLPLP